MKITIEGSDSAPKWETLQNVIREMTNSPQGYLNRVRLFRRNGRNWYFRGPGAYSLTFVRSDGTTIPVELQWS